LKIGGAKGGTKQAMCCLWLRRFSIQADATYLFFCHILRKIPINAVDSVFLYDNGKRWVYSKNRQEKNLNKPGGIETVEIEPNSSLTIVSHYHYRDIITHYKLHLKGRERGEYLIIDGHFMWGTFLDYDVEYIIGSI
jgi:hypothetical protein